MHSGRGGVFADRRDASIYTSRRRHTIFVLWRFKRADPAEDLHERAKAAVRLHRAIPGDATAVATRLHVERGGAFAVAPNYYFRAETNGVDLTKIGELPKLFPIVNVKTDTELFADLDATVAWAKSQGGDTSRLGIIGFCRGGRNVWHYSTHNPNLKAGVAFYGSLIDKNDAAPKSSIDLAPEVKEPVLGLYGEADTGIPPDQVKQMEAALKAAGKTAEFHEYPGAPHGFVADYRPSYRKEAAEDAWNNMTAWFKKYGVLG